MCACVQCAPLCASYHHHLDGARCFWTPDVQHTDTHITAQHYNICVSKTHGCMRRPRVYLRTYYMNICCRARVSRLYMHIMVRGVWCARDRMRCEFRVHSPTRACVSCMRCVCVCPPNGRTHSAHTHTRERYVGFCGYYVCCVGLALLFGFPERAQRTRVSLTPHTHTHHTGRSRLIVGRARVMHCRRCDNI